MATTDLAEFADRMDKLSQVVGKNIGRAISGSTRRAAIAAVGSTRVKTGRARAGWNASIGASVDGPLHLRDKRGLPTVERVRRVTLRYKAGQVMYLSNGVPYIGGLNRADDMSGRAVKAAVDFLRTFKFLNPNSRP